MAAAATHKAIIRIGVRGQGNNFNAEDTLCSMIRASIYEAAMICQYEYKDQILFQTFPEVLSDSDIRLIHEEIEIIEKEYSVLPDFVVNLTNVKTFQGDYKSIQRLAKQREEKKFPNNILESIIVSNDFQMGFARMYQTCNENPQVVIKIFKEEAKAIEWIKSQRTVSS